MSANTEAVQFYLKKALTSLFALHNTHNCCAYLCVIDRLWERQLETAESEKGGTVY